MKAKVKNNLVSILLLSLLGAACLWTGSTPDVSPTPLPTPTAEATLTSEPAASPTAAAGSYADFQMFAAEIAAALQARDASFLGEHAKSSIWHCLGEETLGVCQGIPADTTLEGIPVTHEWKTYEVYDVEDYQEMWEAAFASHSDVKLAATANHFGDNPLMPLASQSFFAIVSIEDAERSTRGVRVLFFEHIEAWQLVGELVTVEQSWVDGTCSTCYDLWTAWQD